MKKKKDKSTADDLNKTLNTLASTLMGQVPADVTTKADGFLKEVGKAVQVTIGELEKQVKAAESKLAAAEKQLGDGGPAGEELFVLQVAPENAGQVALYRASAREKGQELSCIQQKKRPDQPVFCGAHCAGFKILGNGNVEICNGSVRCIERE